MIGRVIVVTVFLAMASGSLAVAAHAPQPAPTPGTVPAPSAAPAASPTASASTPTPNLTETPTPSSTVTPLPPPPVPPPDAQAISPTTAPIGNVSPKPRPTVAPSFWLGDATSSTVPLSMHGGRPFVPVVLDGVRRDFLLSSIRQTTVDDSVPVNRGGDVPTIRTLQIGAVRFIASKVATGRIMPFAQTYLGSPATGVLGTDLFARYPVTIDYADSTITIYRDEAAALGARPAGVAPIPLSLVNGLPTVQCGIDGKGAPPCFVDVYADEDVGLWGVAPDLSRRSIGVRDAEPDHEMNGTVERARVMTIGGTTVSGPLVDRMGAGEAPVPNAAVRAVIGSGVLSRFIVTIDELGGALILAPNPNAPPAWSPFDGSGLWLVARNGQVVVRGVVPRSPADRAGLRTGDVLLTIDGKPPVDLDAAVHSFERPTGTKVALAYQRGKVRKNIVLALRSLI